MNIYNYRRRNLSSGIHFIGILLIAVGVIVAVISLITSFNPPFDSMMPLSLSLLAIGLVIVNSFGGTEINFTKNTFRDYSSIFGFKIGEWSTIPPTKKIKVKLDVTRSINVKNGISPTLSGIAKEYKVVLYADAPTPYVSFTFSKKEKALRASDILAHNFNVKVEVEV